MKAFGTLTWLSLLICLAGSGFIQKYAGTLGVLAYAGFVTVVLGVLAMFESHLLRTATRWKSALAAISTVALIAFFAILNPWEDGKGPGKSSDRDEGLNMAVERIADGQSPYYPSNSTAGPLSVLPGAMILASPFVALGDSGYQNVFWIFVFIALAAWHFRSHPKAWFWAMFAVFISPAVAYEYISGGDLIANGIYVPLAFSLALHAWQHPGNGYTLRILSAIFVGICLTSRSNFPFLIPLFGVAIWRLSGMRAGLSAGIIATTTIVALTVPLYLHDPAGFTPLMSRQKLAGIDHVLPHASWLLVGCTALAGVATAFLLLRKSSTKVLTRLFQYAAIVILTPMILLVTLQSIANGRFDCSLMHDRFGILYLFFALLGWGHQLFTPPAAAIPTYSRSA